MKLTHRPDDEDRHGARLGDEAPAERLHHRHLAAGWIALLQSLSVTVTVLGNRKSFAVSDCHSIL